MTKTLCCLLLGLAGLILSPAALAQAGATAPADAASAPAAAGQGTQYSKEGADTCLKCHDGDEGAYSATAVFKSKHAQRGDKRTPFGVGGLQCEACHGPGGEHASRGSKKKLTINSFKASSFLSVAQRNASCLGCHEGQARTAWHGSAHDRSQVACSDCHKVHVEHDPMLSKKTQADVCFACHTKQRADFHKASAHPVRQGSMACSDCHNPHGSAASTAMLVKPTVNQTCYSCHADKRGPLLWEHAPVAEDCTLCHTPHGSVRPAMLAKSPPLLCQQCHAAGGHPSVARTGAALPGGSAAAAGVFLVAGSCTNCHSQVHGSNHPSGAKLMR